MAGLELNPGDLNKYIHFERAWKGIKMGVALGETARDGKVYRHYLMMDTGLQAECVRERLLAQGRVPHQDMYCYGRMMTYIQLGGEVQLRHRTDSSEEMEEELDDMRMAIRLALIRNDTGLVGGRPGG